MSHQFFLQSIARSLGAPRREVKVGPRHGVDVGVIRLSRQRSLLLTTDPLCLIPSFGWEGAARYAFHVLANDLTTTGVAPQYLSVDWNLPVEMAERDMETVLRALHDECRKFGTAIVAGHTGRYPGVSFPMVGGATLFSVAKPGTFVTSADACPGSRVLLTRTAALETAVTVAHLHPHETEELLGIYTTRSLRRRLEELSSSPEALTATRVAGLGSRGVSAMHDVAEGGIVGALVEMSSASRLDLEVDLSQVPVEPEVGELCSRFGADPLTSMGQGSLLLAVHSKQVDAVVHALERHRLPVTDLGRFGPRARADPRVRDRGRSVSAPTVDGLTVISLGLERGKGGRRPPRTR